VAVAAESTPLESGARLVPRTNYHMTLAFVGAVAAPLLDVLCRIGSAQRAAAFALRFDAYEYWPKSEVIVATARSVPAELERLWEQLHRDLAEYQCAVDPKPLRPHVTLARKVSQPPVLQAMSAFDWLVRDFSLMRSDTSGVQSAYTVVHTWQLLDDPAKA
jgi:2'-5' RNA ligase